MRSFFTCCFLLTGFFSFSQVNFTSSDLPIIILNTNETIPDEPKIPGTMQIINNPGTRNNVTDVPNEFTGNIGIEVRGESSQMFPMKSYSIELRDANGDDMDQSIFGLPAESDWVLYAPYTDKTLMRNVLAYNLSNGLGHWAPHTKFVEVVLNGEYVGVYAFLENIKRKRVGIKKLEGADSTGNNLTGGYIFAIDKDADAWYSAYTTPNTNGSIRYKYVYPKTEDILPVQQDYIKNYVDSFENALANPDFADPVTGYRQFIDEPSFIDYFLINEISRNVDGYRISSYFTKDRNTVSKKIKAGPVWDYDLGFRNADYCNGSDTSGWAYRFNYVCGDFYGVPFWWDRFMEDPTFQSNLLCRWIVLRQGVLSNDHINSVIDSAAAVVNEAQQRHFTKWPILGQYVWPNASPIPTSYAGELSTLKNWLMNRLSWIDNNIAKVGACSGSLSTTTINLNVAAVSNTARLNWSVNSVENAAYFTIDRSIDGINFNAISQVAVTGSNGSVLNYSATDLNLSQHSTGPVYYRVRLINRTGVSTTSNTVVVDNNKASLAVAVFPNPIKDYCNLTVTSATSQRIRISVTNSIGQLVSSSEKNILTGATQVRLESANWPDGIYSVLIVGDNGKAVVSRFKK